MRAIRVTELSGPESVQLVEVDEPAADGGAAPDSPQTLRDAQIRNRLFDAQAAENAGDVAACEAAVAAAERELR